MRTTTRLLATALVAAATLLHGADATADAPAYDVALHATHDKVEALRGLAATLQKVAEEPDSAKLTPEQRAEAKKYDAWIQSASERVLQLAASWDRRVDTIRAGCAKEASCDKVAATKAVSEANISFNLQYLQLQSQIQHENRSYTAVSNIMKTKHDTVKNSISNVR